MNTGQRIKEKRLELGLTLEELGKKLGRNKSTVLRYENGEIENMPIDVVKPIADALNTTPAYLLGWEEEEDAQKQANAYQDEVETELAPLFDMNLTKEEAQALVQYAKFLVSQRG